VTKIELFYFLEEKIAYIEAPYLDNLALSA